jgi:para-nitrobenzyl esterase
MCAAESGPPSLARRRWIAGSAAGLGGLVFTRRLVAGAAEAPLLRTRSGLIEGVLDNDINVFRGVPYAADTRAFRFQRASRELPWEGRRLGVEPAAAAPQTGRIGPQSEDCLRLNLFTPGLADGARRPVLVYVHGGGYSTGWASDPLYDGGNLCRAGDVVVVVVQHRLNALGYLYLGGDGDPRLRDAGNVGQLDLIDALRWVQEHAGAFGGDPGNVTLFGQSGGGAKIATLMAMPEAAGLFHRAWTMSGQQVTAAGPRAAARRAGRYLEALGLGPGEGAKLLDVSLERIVEATRVADPSPVENMSLYFGPVMDSRALPRHPFWPDAPPQSAAIPMVIGNTRDETRAFLGQESAHHSLNWEVLPDRLRQYQFVDLDPHRVIDEYRRLYPTYSASEVFFAATTAGRSWRGAVEELEARARQGAPTWAYQLDWYPEGGERLRAFHTLDIPLVFSNTQLSDAATGDAEGARTMAARMSGSLLAFARDGVPAVAGAPEWPAYSIGHRETLVFDHHTRLEHDPRGGERRLYARVPFIQRGTN